LAGIYTDILNRGCNSDPTEWSYCRSYSMSSLWTCKCEVVGQVALNEEPRNLCFQGFRAHGKIQGPCMCTHCTLPLSLELHPHKCHIVQLISWLEGKPVCVNSCPCFVFGVPFSWTLQVSVHCTGCWNKLPWLHLQRNQNPLFNTPTPHPHSLTHFFSSSLLWAWLFLCFCLWVSSHCSPRHLGMEKGGPMPMPPSMGVVMPLAQWVCFFLFNFSQS